jgi:hypothetical protein
MPSWRAQWQLYLYLYSLSDVVTEHIYVCVVYAKGNFCLRAAEVDWPDMRQ